MPGYTTDWVGCGECDSAFPCWGGERRCIRLAPDLKAPQGKAILYPLSAKVGKFTWYPYAIRYKGDEGNFIAHIYATNDYHAKLILEDLKGTAELIGKVINVS